MGTQTAVPPQGATGTPGAAANPIMSFLPMLVVIAILYLLVIRPSQRQAKEHRRMVDNLKAGDRVLTQGGIFGTVTALKGSVIQIKIAENVRVDVNRSAITQVILEPGAAAGTGEKA